MSASPPISSLPLAISLDGSEEVPIVQGGTTKRTTVAAMSTFPASGVSFVVATATPALTGSRLLAGQSGVVTITDGGPLGNITVGIGIIPANNGGTGIASPTAHDILIGNGAAAMTQLAPSATSGIPLVSQGAGADPAYSTASAPGGGTGFSSYTIGDTLYASAANALSKLAGNITTSKQYLSQTGSGAASAAPVWATIGGADITGAALTAANDTNVTLTLGGTPATSLLRAASVTAGWTGTLAVARGGTGGGSASGTLLDNITGFSSTGFIQRTGAGTYTFSASVPASSVTVGTTTVGGGTTTRVLFDNAGVLGEYTISGTGSVAMTASPTFTGTLTAGNANFGNPVSVATGSATAFAVAANGTNPAFQVDSSVGSQVAGLKVTGAVTGGSVGLAAIDTGPNTNLNIDAKGNGNVNINTTATGVITLVRATTISAALTYGGVTLSNSVTGTGSMVLSTSPTLVTPALGTPSSGTLSNCSIPSSQITGLAAGANTFLTTGTSANLAAMLTDETGTGVAVFGTSPTVTTPNIVGTTAVGNASAGSVGEYVSSVIASGSAVALTTGTPANMTSISLTAGDWDVWYIPNFIPGATTNITQLLASISTTTATPSLAGDSVSFTTYGSSGVVPAVNSGAPMLQKRINVSGTTTVFAVAQCSFTVSTLGAWGSLQARRVR